MKRRTLSLVALAAAVTPAVLAWAQAPNAPPQPRPVVRPWQVQHGVQMKMQLQNRLLQRGVVRQAAEGDLEPGDGYAFHEDRETLTVLRKAEELREQKRFAEAVEALGRLLDGGEDHFIKPENGANVYRSAKTESRRRLAEMPREGRESYELQFGALARQSLDDAVARGDLEGIAEVARRFFHTRAGYEATFLIGLDHADHGRPLAAAHVWSQLLALEDDAKGTFEPLLSVFTAKALRDAGRGDDAKELLIAARKRYAEAHLQIGGAPLAWFEGDDQALDWLKQLGGEGARSAIPNDWTMYRGGPARNEASAGGAPLLAYRWRVPTANDDPAVERAVAQMHRTYEDEGLTTLPGLHPLAVGDTILMRTARNLMAIDFRTGKRLWEVPADNPFEQLPSGAGNQTGGGVGMVAGRNGFVQDSSQGLYEALERRLWDDAVYGTLSSDGQLVFAVEPADSDASVYTPQMMVFGGGNGRVQMAFNPNGAQANRLAAYEIGSGKLKWEIGGPKGNYPLEQAGAFFLGTPLPLFGKLYVLAEADGEIRLMALESATGALAWSQQIAVGAQEFLTDQMPRQAGASPSYADGVLVCPTSAGAVVAIDLASRALLWGMNYPRQIDQWMFGQGRNQIIQMNMFPGGRDTDAQLRWYDSTATIANGRILLAPPDSDKLTCLDLLTGDKLWETDRDDGLYVACVEGERVIVIGAERVRAFALADGAKLWTDDRGQLPDGAHPSGRGFLSEQVYYLPTTAGEVLGIDLNDGQFTSAARSMTALNGSRAERASLGNLICHRGSVISHSVEYLECFDQLKALAERTSAILAATPDDPAALMRMGEIQLQSRDFPGAIASLRRAWELEPDGAARSLLIDAYLTVLEQDFAAAKDQLDEIEPVLQTPAERSAFLRLKASGLEAGGDRVAAFAAYQDLANASDLCPAQELETVKSFWRVRCERLVRGHLERLHEAAVAAGDKSAAEEMERRVSQQWNQLLGAGEPDRDAVERFVAHYGGFQVAGDARLQLAELRAKAGDWLAAELLFLDLEASEDGQVARDAWARHAKLMADAGRPADAAAYYARLAGEWADAKCGEQRTGREWVDALPEDHPVRGLLAGGPSFLEGMVQATELNAEFNPNVQRTIVDIDGKRGPFGRSQTYFVSQSTQRSALTVDDGLGKRAWELRLADPKQPELPIAVPNVGLSQGRLHGHLLLIAYGFHLFAVDSLGDAKQGEPHVLWRADLSDTLPGMARVNGIISQQMMQKFGPLRNYALDQFQRRVGNTACLGEIGLVYQRGRTLCCVSPLTGEPQWTRDDVAPGSELFGDGEVLCVLPPGSQEVLLFDAVDGHELGRRPSVPPEQRVLIDGRCIVSWVELGPRKSELRCQDMVLNRMRWSESFDGLAKAWVVDNEAIAVLEPSGAFKILNIADGRPVVNEMLALEDAKRLGDIYVLAGRDQYTLLVNESMGRRREAMPVQAGLNNPTVNAQGKLYAFDRKTGKQIWGRPSTVLAQGVALRQPADLPVIVFMSQKTSGRTAAQREINLLCIDKRTGRQVYDSNYKMADNPNGLQLTGDVVQGIVTIATKGKTVELKFTDTPAPPDAAGDLQARRAGPGGTILSALKALGKASQDLSSPFGPSDAVEMELQEGEGEMRWLELRDAQEIEALPEPPFDDGIPDGDDDPFGGDE